MLGLQGGPPAERARRALKAFERAVRAVRVYNLNNVALQRTMDELERGFAETFAAAPELTLGVRSDAFVLGDAVVLEGMNPEDSIPFAFFRDGVRRLTFAAGLRREELTALVQATAQGLRFSGIGDDIVSALWRADLEHVDHVVVEMSVVEASAAGTPAPDAGSGGLDQRLDGLIREIFGEGTETGGFSIRLDGADRPARAIARALDEVDVLGARVHPHHGPAPRAAFAAGFVEAALEEGEGKVAGRAVEGMLAAIGASLATGEAAALEDAVIRVLDAAMIEGRLVAVARLAFGLRQLPLPPALLERWMAEVVSEARTRHAAALLRSAPSEELRLGVLGYFRAAGPWAVAPLLALLPSFPEAGRRRELCEVVLELGLPDPALLRPLLESEQTFLALEALHLLARLDAGVSGPMLEALLRHPSPPVRAALAETAPGLEPSLAEVLLEGLVDDPDVRVRATGLAALARKPGRASEATLEALLSRPTFPHEAPEVRKAALEAYAQLAGSRALNMLSRLVRDGEGLFVAREVEDLAVAALRALGLVRARPVVDFLKRTCSARSRRVRETAREVLVGMKGHG